MNRNAPSNKGRHEFYNIAGPGYMTILCPLSWIMCGVMKMPRIFWIADSSPCHTTVITVKISGCSAKVRELQVHLK